MKYGILGLSFAFGFFLGCVHQAPVSPTPQEGMWLALREDLDGKALENYPETGFIALSKSAGIVTSGWEFPNDKAPDMEILVKDYCGELAKRATATNPFAGMEKPRR